MAWLSDIDHCDIAISQGFDITYGRLAEESTVFPVKLAHTFVADLVPSACGIETVHQHSLACGLEPQLFLILQRAHCGKRGTDDGGWKRPSLQSMRGLPYAKAWQSLLSARQSLLLFFDSNRHSSRWA